MRSYTFTEAISRMIMTTNRVGETMGRVMWKNWVTLLAPSMEAASYSCGSMPLMAAK